MKTYKLKRLLTICLSACAISVSAQQADLQKIHSILSTVEQNYKDKITMDQGACTIRFTYQQQLDNPNATMFSSDAPDKHFPLTLFKDRLSYSQPFPGFPHKPAIKSTITISKTAITLELIDHDIVLMGDLDSQGNDKKPADPFTKSWECHAGTSTLDGLIALPNRKMVRVNATNTCSHSYKTLTYTASGWGQKSDGKWVKSHGGPNYYPDHKFDHNQTTTYSIAEIEKAAEYTPERFIYEMVNGGIYFMITNKEHGALKFYDEDRLCIIYAFWNIFGMTDAKYIEMYKSLLGSSAETSASLETEYQQAMQLYKSKDYANAATIYGKLRFAYKDLASQATLESERNTCLSRMLASNYRYVYAVLQSPGLTSEQMNAACDTANAIIKNNKNFEGLTDFVKNTADILSETGNYQKAYGFYVDGFNLISSKDHLTAKETVLRMDFLTGIMFMEYELLENGTLTKFEDCQGLPFAIDRKMMDKYFDMVMAIPDPSKGTKYRIALRDLRVLLACSIGEESPVQSAVSDLFSELGEKVTEEMLKPLKSYPVLKKKYPNVIKEQMELYNE